MVDPGRLPVGMTYASGAVTSRDGTKIGWQRLGDGPPLVVCHGSFAVAADWLPFAVELAETRTVVLYDRRGRGSSPTAATGAGTDGAVDAEVDDLAAVVALAGPGAAVLGHSFGGGCVLAFAARERFADPVIVYEPRHAIDGPVSAGHLEEIRRLVADDDPEVALRAVLDTIIGLPAETVTAFADSPLWARMLETIASFPDELRLLDSLRWRRGDLEDITGQVWLLVGDDSPVLPADREGALRGVLPALRRVTLAGQGHFGYLTAPIALARVVRDCLQAAAEEAVTR